MKLFFTLLLIFVTTSVHAQLNKGLIQLGGSFSSSYGNIDRNSTFFNNNMNIPFKEDRKDFVFNINPDIGFFIKDNLSLIFGIGYGHFLSISDRSSTNVENQQRFVSNSWNLAMSSRLHKPISDDFFLFMEPSVTLGIRTTKDNANIQNERTDTFSIGIAPGILYMLSNKFGLESSFGFLGYRLWRNRPTEDSESTSERTESRIGVDLSSTTLELGLRYYF